MKQGQLVRHRETWRVGRVEKVRNGRLRGEQVKVRLTPSYPGEKARWIHTGALETMPERFATGGVRDEGMGL